MSDLRVTYMQYWSVGHAIGKVIVIIQSIASSTALIVANTCPLTQTMFAIGISTFRVEKQLSKYLQILYVLVYCQRASDTHLNSLRHSYRSVQYGNGKENIESSPPHCMSLKSSPAPSDSDPDADIDAYINWHIRKTPTHADLLNAAQCQGETLSGGYDIENCEN